MAKNRLLVGIGVCVITVGCVVAYAQSNMRVSHGFDARIRTLCNIEDDDAYESLLALHTRLRAHARYKASDAGLEFFVSGAAKYSQGWGGVRYRGAHCTLGQAYVHWDIGSVSLRAGKQVFTWGKLDNLTILDRLNPQDYRYFILDNRQDRKLPVYALAVTWHGSDWNIEAVYEPVFRPSRLRYFGSDWALFGHLKTAVAEAGYDTSVASRVSGLDILPQDTINEDSTRCAQGALRITGRVAGIDAGLYYMSMYNSIAALRERAPAGVITKEFLYVPNGTNLNALMQSSLAEEQLRIEAQYQRSAIAGIDAETVMGAWGVRAEAAWLARQPFVRRDFSYISKDMISTGLGVDRMFDNGLYCNVQGLYDYVVSYQDMFAQERSSTQMFARVRKEYAQGRIVYTLEGSYNFARGDWMSNPYISYELAPAMHIGAGAFIFDGKPETLFGRFNAQDTAYVEWSYVF